MAKIDKANAKGNQCLETKLERKMVAQVPEYRQAGSQGEIEQLLIHTVAPGSRSASISARDERSITLEESTSLRGGLERYQLNREAAIGGQSYEFNQLYAYHCEYKARAKVISDMFNQYIWQTKDMRKDPELMHQTLEVIEAIQDLIRERDIRVAKFETILYTQKMAEAEDAELRQRSDERIGDVLDSVEEGPRLEEMSTADMETWLENSIILSDENSKMIAKVFEAFCAVRNGDFSDIEAAMGEYLENSSNHVDDDACKIANMESEPWARLYIEQRQINFAIDNMRQPAPIRGARMETILIQAIAANTPTDEDAPPWHDHRTEQHITVEEPDGIRHSSDPNRYLINRHAAIGGHAVNMSDILADNHAIKTAEACIATAIDELEKRDNERRVSRKNYLRATNLLKTLLSGVIEDHQTSLDKLATWAYARGFRECEGSDAQVSADESGGGGFERHEFIFNGNAERIATLRSVSEHQTSINKLMLESLEDVERNVHYCISVAMHARGLTIQLVVPE
ncbi:hypothetical protein DSL72_001819 [Monilinia vaccinii-corymbosi]|uniref:Uncharacterized protein n=1 Tax=Monilinia vaccinii-corymbosi TaxID=61207 RepID=A0A8A3PAW3_9HELO|nr:hypothetical protein DSL72_001819 [Monilinia vaccinii-corymbosi]